MGGPWWLCGNGDFGRLAGGAAGRGAGGTAAAAAAAVACGGAHTLLLGAGPQGGGHRVWAAGLGDEGQLGAPPPQGGGQGGGAAHAPAFVEVENLRSEGVVAVAAGHRHSAAVTEDGRLFTWGSNRSGQLGLGRAQAGACVGVPALVQALGGVKVAAVALGAEHTLALSEAGEVFAWGASGNGRLGHAAGGGAAPWEWRWWAQSEPLPRLVRALEGRRVAQVAAGHHHSGCVCADTGDALLWGAGRFQQLGRGEEGTAALDSAEPVAVDLGGHSCAALALGGLHSAALTGSGRVYTWGTDEGGSLGHGRGVTSAAAPRAVEGLPGGASQVACGWKHTAAAVAGRLFTWGWGGAVGEGGDGGPGEAGAGGLGGGQLGHPDPLSRAAPSEVRPPSGLLGGVGDGRPGPLAQVSCGFNHTGAVFAAP